MSGWSQGTTLVCVLCFVLLTRAPSIGVPLTIIVAAVLVGIPMRPAVAFWNWAILERLFPRTTNFWLSGRGSYLESTARTRTCWCVPRPCEGSNCNAWRWNRNIFNWRGVFTRRRGRCDTSAYRDIVVKRK